jgi:hypothetical protein
MTVIPNFILKRMYKSGSFRRLPEGVGFDIINNLGPGQISLIQCIKLNGQIYSAEQLLLIINGEAVPASSIQEDNPATFFLNQVITCVIQDTGLAAGRYDLTLELVSREAGKVSLSVSDTLANV